MRECHLKMICNDRGDARREWTLKSDAIFVIKEGFEVHSALYGDGKSRYTDVTKTVQGWTEDALWPENWEELLYAQRKPRPIYSIGVDVGNCGDLMVAKDSEDRGGLVIHSARYGVLNAPIPFREHSIDVTERVRSLVKGDSLDIVVNNSTLTPGENPYRGKKKVLLLTYGFGDREGVTIEREEKDWLIIGSAQRTSITTDNGVTIAGNLTIEPATENDETTIPNLWPKSISHPPQTPAALNNYLIRKFSISPQRLRGPMPIELRDFHRNDLAQLFAELGFKRGAEIGVAEGNYSEVLLKANPNCELLLVDPWHHYSENPQGKSKERHEFAYNEVLRKVVISKSYNVQIIPQYSMDGVKQVRDESLDFCYIDGNHLFDYCMQDLIEWSKRVRSGGIVSGDDYYELDQKRWTGGSVVEAVQAYTKAHRIPIWWLFAGHKSVDFMWVKP